MFEGYLGRKWVPLPDAWAAYMGRVLKDKTKACSFSSICGGYTASWRRKARALRGANSPSHLINLSDLADKTSSRLVMGSCSASQLRIQAS